MSEPQKLCTGVLADAYFVTVTRLDRGGIPVMLPQGDKRVKPSKVTRRRNSNETAKLELPAATLLTLNGHFIC